ncbi:MAG: complex I subunit 1/NuoH family protein [Chloroflexota bacterium]
MNAFISASIVFGGLLVGIYGIAVLDRLVKLGPRHAGNALVAPILEAVSLARQQDLVPRNADGLLFRSAPLVALTSIALAALVIPVGPGLVGLDTSVGVFYFIVVLSPFVPAMMNAGWGQNAKEGLFGAFRAATHLLSYEVPLGFAAIGPVIAAQSLSTVQIVERQASLLYAAWQPLGLAIYLVASLFMSYRHPFDIPQAGSELAGGVLAEYSGLRLLLFKAALDGIFFLLMAMAVVLFFGGWLGPLLPGPLWFAIKTFLLAYAVLWLSRFAPRLRHDQMLSFSWKVLIPAALLNVLVVGVPALFLFGGGG